jgi:hypothetical protein
MNIKDLLSAIEISGCGDTETVSVFIGKHEHKIVDVFSDSDGLHILVE